LFLDVTVIAIQGSRAPPHSNGEPKGTKHEELMSLVTKMDLFIFSAAVVLPFLLFCCSISSCYKTHTIKTTDSESFLTSFKAMTLFCLQYHAIGLQMIMRCIYI